MRFRLDPSAPERAPASPPPQARPATDPAPRVAPAPPETPRAGRKALMLAAIVVVLLLVGGAVAIYAAGAFGFPSKYVLDAGERPAGMANARLTAAELDELGIEENPGELSAEDIEDWEHDLGREDGHAKEANIQVLSTSSGGRVLVFAARYANEDDARAASGDLRAVCSFASGAVLRDGSVVVTVLPDDGATRIDVRAVAGALREKTSDLRAICGL